MPLSGTPKTDIPINMKRILSIDTFRGFTIFMMVFVNELAGVANIPAWMKHVPADADAMTFVDVVFPAFLFIVGMAIPFAVKNRLEKGESQFEFWKHVVIRTVGLLIIGVFMVNSEEMNPELNLIPKALWDVLLYLSVIAVWNIYPKAEGNKKIVFNGLKILGGLVLIALAVLYKKGSSENSMGMTTSWWGILGLIGWAYFYSMVVFILFKKGITAMVATFFLFIILVLGLKNDALELPIYLEWLKGQSGNIAHAALTVAGIVLSLILMDEKNTGKIKWMLTFGAILAIAAYFIRPYYGISKIYATPSWVLYCGAICCFLFSLFYWMVDMKGIKNWANFLKPAGQNPLLTYILPPIFYACFGFAWLPDMFNEGVLGFFRAVVFSLFILWVSGLLTKKGMKLHL